LYWKQADKVKLFWTLTFLTSKYNFDHQYENRWFWTIPKDNDETLRQLITSGMEHRPLKACQKMITSEEFVDP
jgi:hypothetical protein